MDTSHPAQLGSFQILERLGQGGFTEVLLAQELRAGRLGELVALKRLRPGLIQRDPVFLESLLIEAELGMMVNDPHVVRVACVIDADGEPALIMEYVEGYRLDILFKLGEGTGLPPEVAVCIAAQVARGLAALHAARDAGGVPFHAVHQDIKPGNILVTRAGVARVLDFNTARPQRDGQHVPVWIRQGTPGYRSPEQTRGDWRLTPASDLYGLGVVLYELLTGRRLFADLPPEPDAQLARQKQVSLKIELVAAKVAPPGLDALLSRMLAWSLDERATDALELAVGLEQWQKVWAPRFSLGEFLVRHRVRLEALALRHKSEQDIHRVDTELGERRSGPESSGKQGAPPPGEKARVPVVPGTHTLKAPPGPLDEPSRPEVSPRVEASRGFPPGAILRASRGERSEHDSAWQKVPYQQPPWLAQSPQPSSTRHPTLSPSPSGGTLPDGTLPGGTAPDKTAPGAPRPAPDPRSRLEPGTQPGIPEPHVLEGVRQEPPLPYGGGMNAVQPGIYDGPAWHPPSGTPPPRALKLPPDPRTSQPGYREPARVSGSWTPRALLGQLTRPFARRQD